jgi:hypothetical protein
VLARRGVDLEDRYRPPDLHAFEMKVGSGPRQSESKPGVQVEKAVEVLKETLKK